ncbi:MAG: O-methyltransferase [Cytophagales bacterium]|nr:O-methyltransferase [Bernardetiaceae bacterium]MDW8211534.1 O-methyltransferase [Cytophagales bacterium]
MPISQWEQAAVERYAEAHTTPDPPLLNQLVRETHLKTTMPRMLSGPLQGALLSLLTRLIRPTKILEIGTFTGYSALCLAQGLAPEGKLITIDCNEETSEIARRYFAQAGLADKINILLGDAAQILPTLNEVFDLVYIDADKRRNADYYQMVLPKVRPEGLILIDNVLWSGKVLSPDPTDKDTAAIVAFNRMVQEDSRVKNLLLPIRDGLMIVQKL